MEGAQWEGPASRGDGMRQARSGVIRDVDKKRGHRLCWWYSQGRLADPDQTHGVSVFSPTSQLSWLARLATDSWQTPSRHSI